MLSLYIHIPFCETKCKYCSFFVAPGIKDKQLIENYYTALLKEIDIRSSKLKDKAIKTIYLGGGTPLFL
jgi:oxygen-independent coproporphyrinogen-3 oxidase